MRIFVSIQCFVLRGRRLRGYKKFAQRVSSVNVKKTNIISLILHFWDSSKNLKAKSKEFRNKQKNYIYSKTVLYFNVQTCTLYSFRLNRLAWFYDNQTDAKRGWQKIQESKYSLCPFISVWVNLCENNYDFYVEHLFFWDAFHF